MRVRTSPSYAWGIGAVPRACSDQTAHDCGALTAAIDGLFLWVGPGDRLSEEYAGRRGLAEADGLESGEFDSASIVECHDAEVSSLSRL